MTAGGEHRSGRACDPEGIFELAEGALYGEKRARLLMHLESCGSCRARYEREKSLSAGLCVFGGDREPEAHVAREVAFSLPTRSAASKVAWGTLAALLLVFAGGALVAGGAGSLLGLVGGSSDALWGFVSGTSSVLGSVISSLAPFIVGLLLLGALVDAAIAAVVLYAARRGRVRGGVDARGA